MTRVKICGITRHEDAMAAIDLGASALGFNFYPRSPRYISMRQAARIIENLPPFITKIGVVVNFGPARDIRRLALALSLNGVQLQGEESRAIVKALRPLPVIKAFRVTEDFDLAVLKRYAATAILLDGMVPGKFGGTGKTFDWRVARQVARSHRVLLSGGLTPVNVEKAILEARPYAVDVASGVESSPGQKDFRKMRAFMGAVRRADGLILQ